MTKNKWGRDYAEKYDFMTRTSNYQHEINCVTMVMNQCKLIMDSMTWGKRKFMTGVVNFMSWKKSTFRMLYQQTNKQSVSRVWMKPKHTSIQAISVYPVA